MELLPYALVTVSEAQLILGISGNDDKLKFLINYATDYIEKATDRRFLSTIYTGVTAENLQASRGGRDLFLKQYPIISVSGLEYNNAHNNSDHWEPVDTGNFFIDSAAGIITLNSNSSIGTQNYRISYTGGFATIPNDLKMACIWLVGEAYKRSPNMGIKSESLGDHSLVFDASLMSDDNNPVNKVINRYKRMVLPGSDLS